MVRFLLAGDTNLEVIEKDDGFLELFPNDMFDAQRSPRALNTHYWFDELPTDVLEKKPKIIFILRNPKDVSVSYFNHHKSITEYYEYNGSWNNYLPLVLDGRGSSRSSSSCCCSCSAGGSSSGSSCSSGSSSGSSSCSSSSSSSSSSGSSSSSSSSSSSGSSSSCCYSSSFVSCFSSSSSSSVLSSLCCSYSFICCCSRCCFNVFHLAFVLFLFLRSKSNTVLFFFGKYVIILIVLCCCHLLCWYWTDVISLIFFNIYKVPFGHAIRYSLIVRNTSTCLAKYGWQHVFILYYSGLQLVVWLRPAVGERNQRPPRATCPRHVLWRL